MGSTKLVSELKVPYYTSDQQAVKYSVISGILLTDRDYEIVVDDAVSHYGVDKFEEDSEAYEFIKMKYGQLNINRLNRTLIGC